MTTRHAADNSIYYQNRYASSPEFERGLIANLVAQRCAIIDDRQDRELIWFLQYISHSEGGMESFAKELISQHPECLQTKSMAAIGMEAGKTLSPAECRKIRSDFPSQLQCFFDLKDDVRRANLILDDDGDTIRPAKIAEPESPARYSTEEFINFVRSQAEDGLNRHLKDVCLNPAKDPKRGPWFFPTLPKILKANLARFISESRVSAVVTSLGREVNDALDYTFSIRGFCLMDGNARLGKTYAAKKWCEQHPGQARFIEVPPTNDDAAFFRALARGLGLGNFLRYKVCDVRERVQDVLLSGDLLLVLDEAHRLWPQKNLRYGFPSRINWVMTMANQNVPICAIATPQFIEMQRAAEEKGRWNSAQLTGRISHYVSLPVALSESDLEAVARHSLPEASARVHQVMAKYAKTSARYLAAIDAVAKRARYLARGDKVTDMHVRNAMNESVVPSDSKLIKALERGRGNASRPAPAVLPLEVCQKPVERKIPTMPAGREIGNLLISETPLIQG